MAEKDIPKEKALDKSDDNPDENIEWITMPQSTRSIPGAKNVVNDGTPKSEDSKVRVPQTNTNTNIGILSDRTLENNDHSVPRGGFQWFKPSHKFNFSLSQISEMARELKSNELSKQRRSLIYFRKVLSVENNPPITAVVKSGIIPTLIKLCKAFYNDNVAMLEIVWIFSNIASGNRSNSKAVYESGIIDYLIRILKRAKKDWNDDLVGQICWCVGNIAADFRDDLLEMKFEQYFSIEDLLKRSTFILHNFTIMLCNLVRGKPVPADDILFPIIPFFTSLYSNKLLVQDILWGFSYITVSDNVISNIVKSGIVENIIDTLRNERQNYMISTPALRICGNICSSTNECTTYMLDKGFLAVLSKLLGLPKIEFLKETMWTISNICAGSDNQVSLVFSSNLFQKIQRVYNSSYTTAEIKRECIWCISNALTVCSLDEAKILLKESCIDLLGRQFIIEDPDVIIPALEGVDNFLRIGKEANDEKLMKEFIAPFERYLDRIENLQNHKSRNVYNKAVKILEKYFEVDAPIQKHESEPGGPIPAQKNLKDNKEQKEDGKKDGKGDGNGDFNIN